MTTHEAQAPACDHGGYRHEALFYHGSAGFLDGVVPFLRDAVAADEPTLVALGAERIAAVRDVLGDQADRVLFADMREVGENPARIIPLWERFLSERGGGRRVRGIGEPIWADRRPSELAECERHEGLLNLAFAGRLFWLLCPYDVETLAPQTLAAARRNHPYATDARRTGVSAEFAGSDALAAPDDRPLPEPPDDAAYLEVHRETLRTLRAFVAEYAATHGMTRHRAGDLVIAVNELTVNSVRHGGGRGALRLWREHGSLVCEVRDGGAIGDPLAGRVQPRPAGTAGRGLWMVNQLCELVQIRSSAQGATVRVHMRLR